MLELILSRLYYLPLMFILRTYAPPQIVIAEKNKKLIDLVFPNMYIAENMYHCCFC